MPKNSTEGSVFPNLEQEQRSESHPKRPQITVKKPNNTENGQKTEQPEAKGF